MLARSTVDLGRRVRRTGIEPIWGSPLAYGTGFELQTGLGIFGPDAAARASLIRLEQAVKMSALKRVNPARHAHH